MKISVIIPVYNAEKTIERLLNSVISQTYKNYEVIIINDGSTDKTESIISRYNSSNIKIISNVNEGVGIARKIGFENATGDLVFFCDSDDYIPENNIFEKINEKFIKNNIDILMFDVLDITDKENKVVNCFSKKIEKGIHQIEEIDNCFLFGPLFLKVFRKEKLDKNCFIEYDNFEDTYTTYKYLNNCSNFYYEKDIYYAFDETANLQSLTKIKNIDKFIKTIDLIKLIYKESKLKKSCCISTFNYYLYLISLVQKNKNWDKKKLEELKQKMKELEKIFLKNFEIIQKTQSQENIKKYVQYKNDKKIILIDGISTTGKSTISDGIFNSFKMNGISAKWLHEESLNDINLTLNLPKHESIENDRLIEEMNNLYKRWFYFINNIKNDNVTYILDSNFFKNIHDYMLNSNLSIVEIKKYYNQLIDLFEIQKIYFIFLKRNNIKKSFEDAFKNRGFFWESHFKKHLYEKLRMSINDDSSEKIYEYEQKYQELIESIFDNFKVDKTKIITDEEKWDEYLEYIMNDLGLFYYDEIQDNYDYDKYLGNYSYENWNINIYYDNQKKKMFLSAFWPSIELKYLGNDTFKLKRFPLQMHFIDNKIMFEGDLIWDMKNKYFEKNVVKVLKK